MGKMKKSAELEKRLNAGKNITTKLLKEAVKEQLKEIETEMANTVHLYNNARHYLELADTAKEKENLKEIIKDMKRLMKDEGKIFNELQALKKEIDED
jgi:hypothetical protein